jgi:hypothetical protein
MKPKKRKAMAVAHSFSKTMSKILQNTSIPSHNITALMNNSIKYETFIVKCIILIYSSSSYFFFLSANLASNQNEKNIMFFNSFETSLEFFEQLCQLVSCLFLWLFA